MKHAIESVVLREIILHLFHGCRAACEAVADCDSLAATLTMGTSANSVGQGRRRIVPR